MALTCEKRPRLRKTINVLDCGRITSLNADQDIAVDQKRDMMILCTARISREIGGEGDFSARVQSPKTCCARNVSAIQSKHGDGHPEDKRKTRGVVVRRRVAHCAGSTLLHAAQRGSRQGQVRLILRNYLRPFLSPRTLSSIPASGPVFPRHDDRVLRRTR